MFVGLSLCMTIIDGLLHLFDLVSIGRDLGIPGVLFILLSFVYSPAKRGRIRNGNPSSLLRTFL